MKLGDIKAEAMKLMHASGGAAVSAETVSILGRDSNAREYLIAMTGSINRCFGRIESKGILPHGRYEYRAPLSCTFQLRIPLPEEAARMISVWREGEEGGGLFRSVPFLGYGDSLLVQGVPGALYTLVYEPKIPRVSDADPDTREIAIPDEIAELIPLYIKSELYLEDEPSEAVQARNLFEAAADEVRQRVVSCQGVADAVYGGEML